MSFRDGAQVDHVESIVAVTGDGRVVECSERRHRDLFEMLLAGQGQVGVIVEATLRLVPAPTNVRVYDLVYPDLDPLLADIAAADRGRPLRSDGGVRASRPGPDGWLYLLEAIGYHGSAGPPDDAAPAGRTPPRRRARRRPTSTSSPGRRGCRGCASSPTRGSTCSCRCPGRRRSSARCRTRSRRSPRGDTYNLLLIPLRRSRFGRPLFRTQDEELGVGFDTLRALPAGLDAESVLAFNRRLYDRCTELGGSHYPISAVRLDVDDWAAHYGEQWDRLRAAKRRYDRDDVLAGGPDVLGRRRHPR